MRPKEHRVIYRWISRPARWITVGLLLGLTSCVSVDESVDDVPELRGEAWSQFEQERFEEAAAGFEQVAATGDPEAAFVLGFMVDLGLGVAIDDERALVLQIEAATAGHVLAARYLAWKLRVGFGTVIDEQASLDWSEIGFESALNEKLIPIRWLKVAGREMQPNFQAAVEWNAKEADLGVAYACFNLGRYFAGGRGIETNEVLAIRFLLQAADLGHVPSMVEVMPILEMGLLGDEGDDRLERYQRAAAEAGVVDVQVVLGERLVESEDDLDQAAGMYWLKEAVAEGSAEAAEVLGDLLSEEGATEEELAEAVRYYRIGAELGSRDCQSDLAWHLENGVGVEVNLDEALIWYEQAADVGSSWAARQLGRIIFNGQGRDANVALGIKWFERAAELGDDEACLILGSIYQKGEDVPGDDTLAFEWFERAAREGNLAAQMRLGFMLSRGIGIERDIDEARTWWRLAGDNGDSRGYVLLAGSYRKDGSPPTREQITEDMIEAYRLASEAGDEVGLVYLMISLMLRWDPGDQKEASALLDKAVQLRPEMVAWLGAEMIRRQYAPDQRAEGRDLLRRAYLAGAEKANLDLARSFVLCPEEERDLPQAKQLAEEALKIGAKGARLCMAEVLIAEGLFSDGPSEDPVPLLETLVREDDAVGISLLAGLLLDGILVEADEERAVELYDRAKALGLGGNWIQVLEQSAPPNEVLLDIQIENAMVRKNPNIPLPLHRVAPKYPPILKYFGMEGLVRVAFEVDSNGRPKSAKADSVSHPAFGSRAVKAVMQWRFAPAYEDGVPIETRLMLPMRFNLND